MGIEAMGQAVETNQTNADFVPYKQKPFDAFLLWLSLPSVLKRPPVKASISEFAASMGIDDEEVLALMEIKTQKQFAERYGVNEDTLTAWKRTGRAEQALEELQQWARPLTKNVLFGLYNQCIRGGQPQHYKLWLQVVGGWSEKLAMLKAQRRISTVKIQVLDPMSADAREMRQPPLVSLKRRS